MAEISSGAKSSHCVNKLKNKYSIKQSYWHQYSLFFLIKKKKKASILHTIPLFLKVSHYGLQRRTQEDVRKPKHTLLFRHIAVSRQDELKA